MQFITTFKNGDDIYNWGSDQKLTPLHTAYVKKITTILPVYCVNLTSNGFYYLQNCILTNYILPKPWTHSS